MGDGISIFNTEGDYKAKLAYRIKDESGEKVKIRNPVFKMEWGSIISGKLHFHPKYWRYIVNIDFANKQ